MERFDYLVVGAGFAGSVMAERLASAGRTVLLVDERAHIGGNAYDEYNADGILIHRYGAHVFHTNSRAVFDYLGQFTTWRPYEHRVLAAFDRQLLPMPINATTLAAFAGDQAAARRALVEPYTRKQWGPHADALSPGVLARIRMRPTSTDDRYFTDTYQAMPADGYTRLFERMLASPRIKLLLKTSYREVMGLLPADVATIYTGPIDEFFGGDLGRLPYRSARFRHTTCAFERCQRVGVVNYPAAALAWTRVIEFKHLTGQVHPKTTVAVEYPSADGERFWPVPTAASAALYQRYAERAAALRPRVHFLGRLGTYSYYDMHQVVAQALKLAATLLGRSDESNANENIDRHERTEPRVL